MAPRRSPEVGRKIHLGGGESGQPLEKDSTVWNTAGPGALHGNLSRGMDVAQRSGSWLRFGLVGLASILLLTACVAAKPAAVPSGTSGPGLVQRGSIRPDGWSMQIPSNWARAGP